MAALCDSLSLAIPPLHGHRVDVSRGLRTSGISGSSTRDRERTIHGMAERTPSALLGFGDLLSDGFAACQSGVGRGNTAAQFRFPLFCRAARANSHQPVCAPAASGPDPVSSIGFLPPLAPHTFINSILTPPP